MRGRGLEARERRRGRRTNQREDEPRKSQKKTREDKMMK